MMIKKLEFVCPSCGHDKLEEVLVNAIVYTTMWFAEYSGEDGDGVDEQPDREEPILMNGDVDCYQCVACGYRIRTNATYSGESSGSTITDPDELREWLIAMRDERGE
jgi:predicted RNA-binding Zn-ribbon protein involved in translation (DUF1610 family)